MSTYYSIKALILVGGKSSRLGQEKGLLTINGISLVSRMQQVLSNCQLPVFLSCNSSQKGLFQSDNDVIVDEFDAIGPLGGILSAFRRDDSCDWCVVACDMPNINEASINNLLAAHRSTQITTYRSRKKKYPETTFTIYPKSMTEMFEAAVGKQNYRLQDFLKNHKTTLLSPENDQLLDNINDLNAYQNHLKRINASE